MIHLKTALSITDVLWPRFVERDGMVSLAACGQQQIELSKFRDRTDAECFCNHVHVFSAGAKPNPYARRLKRSITIRVDTQTLEYFQQLAAELEVPYQTLINLYLRDSAESGRRPAMRWRPSGRPSKGAA